MRERNVKEIRKKHLDRREWFTDTERSFRCKRIQDQKFQGAAGLITFTGLSSPMVVPGVDGPLCIADKGYEWLELVPESGHVALTAMFRGEELFQQYLDITLSNEVEKDGNASFLDLLLDMVVLADGTVHVLDMDELEEALAGGSITRDQYALAVKTADEVMRFYKEHARSVEDKLHAYRAMFHAPAGGGGKRDKD